MSNYSRAYINSAFGTDLNTEYGGAFQASLPVAIVGFDDVELTQFSMPYTPQQPSIPIRNNSFQFVVASVVASVAMNYPNHIRTVTIDTSKDYSDINNLVNDLNALVNVELAAVGSANTNIFSFDLTTFKITVDITGAGNEAIILGNWQSGLPNQDINKRNGLLWRLGYTNHEENPLSLIAQNQPPAPPPYVGHIITNLRGLGNYVDVLGTGADVFFRSNWIVKSTALSNWDVLRTQCLYLALSAVSDGVSSGNRTDVITQIPIESVVHYGDMVNKEIQYDFSNARNLSNMIQTLEVEVLDDMFEPLRLNPTSNIMIELHFDKAKKRANTAKARTGVYGLPV